MRALMLTPDEGYLDRRIVHEAGSLAKRGWSVDIYSAVDPVLRYDGRLPSGVRLLRTTPMQRRRESWQRMLLRRVKRAVVHLSPAAGRTVESLQYRSRDITAEIRDHNLTNLLTSPAYDIVFAHDLPVLPLAWELAQVWECALICDLHEVFAEQTAWITSRRGREYWRSIEARFLPACDGIVVVNPGIAEYLNRRYAELPTVVIIHNSLPYVEQSQLGGGSLRAMYDIPQISQIMVWAGTLRDQTNLDSVVRGFALAWADLNDWALAIVGDGPDLPRLARVAERTGAPIYLGRRVPQDELLSTLASADVGLLSYTSDSFNLAIATPNKLYEYIQARLPIATQRLAQVERVVEVHRNGRFVDFSSPESCAAGLKAFIHQELSTITPQILDAAAREFSWEQFESGLIGLVDAACRSKVTSRGPN